MKAIKIILIIAAILFAAFFAIGVFEPTVEYGATVEVSKTPEEAWAVYNDSTLMTEWVPAVKSIKLVSGEHWQEGSKYEILMDHNGQLVTTMEELTRIVENERISMIFSNEMMSIDNEVTFTANENGGTTISSKATAEGVGFFWKSMFALMADGFNQQEAIHFNALAELIERTDVELEEPENVFVSDTLAVDTAVIDSL